MDNAIEEKIETETKPRGRALGSAESSGNKHAEARMANKLKKRRAHKHTLRRSHTNG
jgi:hypothetical protein